MSGLRDLATLENARTVHTVVKGAMDAVSGLQGMYQDAKHVRGKLKRAREFESEHYQGPPKKRAGAQKSAASAFLADSATSLKYKDERLFGVFNALNSDNWITTPYGLIPQGTGDGARVGRKIWIKGIHLNYQLNKIPTVLENISTATTLAVKESTGPQQLRVLILYDRSANNNNALNYQEVLNEDNPSGLPLTGHANLMMNLENSGRFQILYDEMHMMSTTSSAYLPGLDWLTTSYESINIRTNLSCNLPIEFANGLSSSQTRNKIWILFGRNKYSITTGEMEISGIVRFRYTG